MFQNIKRYNVPLLTALIVLNLLDFITTYFCIDMGGSEANPLLAYLMRESGTIWVILYVKLVVIAVLLPFFSIASYYPDLIHQYVRPGFTTFIAWLLLVVNIFYLHVVTNNLWVIYVLSKFQ